MEIIQSLQNRIYEIRGQRVILDKDIAQLYEVETKVLNQSVKRHIERFPEDFMFQLTSNEMDSINFQIIDMNESRSRSRSQFVTLNTTRGSNIKYLPYAFTEQGVAMLSGIINSKTAIQMNIAIMRAFVELRRVLLKIYLNLLDLIIHYGKENFWPFRYHNLFSSKLRTRFK